MIYRPFTGSFESICYLWINSEQPLHFLSYLRRRMPTPFLQSPPLASIDRHVNELLTLFSFS